MTVQANTTGKGEYPQRYGEERGIHAVAMQYPLYTLIYSYRRLSCLAFTKQLFEHPHQGLVVSRPKDFGHKGAAFGEKLDRQLERHENEACLRVGILNPGSTNVGCSVVQNHISLEMLHLLSEHLATLFRRNVTDQPSAARHQKHQDSEMGSPGPQRRWTKQTYPVQPRMGLMGTRSTPTTSEPMGMWFTATCIHPPGAAQRSRLKHTGQARAVTA